MDKISSGINNNFGVNSGKQSDKSRREESEWGVSKGIKDTLDIFVPGGNVTNVDIITQDPEYQNISLDDAAKMLGYFTQKMESEGFPWRVYQPTGGKLRKMKLVGEFEALKRLQKGQPVIFQPMRVLGLGFNPPKLKGKDIAGEDVKGGVSMKSGGMEAKHGAPIQINGFKDLKLLYQLYNPNIKFEETQGNPLKQAARELAFFTKGTMAGQFPWKMYKDEGFWKKLKVMAVGGLKKAGVMAAVGAGVASLFSLPAFAFGSLVGGPIGIGVGAAIGAVYGLFSGANANKQGQEINAFETLHRLNNDQPVQFQELKKTEIGISIPFPISIELGSLTSYSRHGEPSVISSMEDLKLFNKIQEQVTEGGQNPKPSPKEEKK